MDKKWKFWHADGRRTARINCTSHFFNIHIDFVSIAKNLHHGLDDECSVEYMKYTCSPSRVSYKNNETLKLTKAGERIISCVQFVKHNIWIDRYKRLSHDHKIIGSPQVNPSIKNAELHCTNLVIDWPLQSRTKHNSSTVATISESGVVLFSATFRLLLPSRHSTVQW